MKTQEQKRELNKEKNLRYPKFTFRLNAKTAERLLKRKGSQSWNLLFSELLDNFGRPKK